MKYLFIWSEILTYTVQDHVKTIIIHYRKKITIQRVKDMAHLHGYSGDVKQCLQRRLHDLYTRLHQCRGGRGAGGG